MLAEMGIMAGILGVFLTLYALINGKDTKRLIKETHADTMKVLERMNNTLEKISESNERIAELIRVETKGIKELIESK